MEQENDNAEALNARAASTKFQSSEKNDKESGSPGAASSVGESKNFAGASNKPQASQKKNPSKLRARFRGFKKSSASKSLEAKSAKDTAEVRRNRRKKNKKSLPCSNKESNKKEGEDLKKISGENADTNVADKEYIGKGKEIQKNRERIRGSRKRQQKQNIEDRHLIIKKREEMPEEKLGGLIFMYNAKTKPDCFHYRAMGVSMGKKDVVLGVKPELKLFLYDVDLKLMYGIYQASSSGGVRLEPKAFGGSFPVQVRFSVYKDCFPISESVFKKAIKDNYYEKNKFNIELDDRHVRKLSDLSPSCFLV